MVGNVTIDSEEQQSDLELLAWLNDTLQSAFINVEQTCSGIIYRFDNFIENVFRLGVFPLQSFACTYRLPGLTIAIVQKRRSYFTLNQPLPPWFNDSTIMHHYTSESGLLNYRARPLVLFFGIEKLFYKLYGNASVFSHAWNQITAMILFAITRLDALMLSVTFVTVHEAKNGA